MKKSIFALALLASSPFIFSAGNASWGYEGKGGPSNWGSLS